MDRGEVATHRLRRKVLAMDACNLKAAVEDLAAAVVVAEPEDRESLTGLARLVGAVETLVHRPGLPESAAAGGRDLVCAARGFLEHPAIESLSRLGEAVDGLQKEIRRCHKERGQNACSLDVPAENGAGVASPTALPNQALPASKVRDPDTIALIGEFLSESDESLVRGDQILMTVERDGATGEAINGLFRVFHTIKGVAGFLELFDIQSLAHTTESLLNGCREGLYPLVGKRLDLVFDATAMMRKILGDLRVAVEGSREFSTQEDVTGLVERLKAALEVESDSGAKMADETPAPASLPEDVQPSSPAPLRAESRPEAG